MAKSRNKNTEKAPKDCRDCERWNDVKERVRVSESLEKAIKAVETKIKDKDFKPTVAEYLKLIQMEKELKQDDAKEIKVTWVEPAAKSEPER
jgi:hypothetical protein